MDASKSEINMPVDIVKDVSQLSIMIGGAAYCLYSNKDLGVLSIRKKLKHENGQSTYRLQRFSN